jgi:predicted ATP-binding protein involved in virulence
LDRIYTEDGISPESSKFLNYFLDKLGTVISATTDVERSVEEFVSSCNKYLLSDEITTRLPGAVDADVGRPVDGKQLRLNRKNLSVHVESVPEGRKITLDALSSGEKQMISLFAKLFLYEGPKIVLIDEPELSLSIDWQRQILVDVMNAPLCRQVIAITHSPFVFDNDLEPFAKSLQLSASNETPPLTSNEGEDFDE